VKMTNYEREKKVELRMKRINYGFRRSAQMEEGGKV